MNKNRPNELKLVTKLAMELIQNKEILLPSTYRILFSMVAKENGINIGAEGIHTKKEFNDEIYTHIKTINNNTSRAIAAIKKKDNNELQSVLKDTQKLKQEVESLQNVAYEDALTKALNRKWFEDNHLSAENATFTKEGILVLVDLNNFKNLNDNLGHTVGDKVLIHLTARLKKLSENVVRYDGDKFIILFNGGTEQEVKEVVHVVREILLKKKFQIMDNELKIRFAYGISQFNIDDDFNDIIQTAENRMNEDKVKVKERSA